MSSISERAGATSYEAARHRTAYLERLDRALVVVSGADRRAYLQGLLTNDVGALTAGTGCYAAYLTPQGRMIADLFVYELGDVILLTVPAAVKEAVLARLDQFIFSEDVQLGDVTEAFSRLALMGPDSARVLSAVLTDADESRLAALAEHGNLRAPFGGEPAMVTRTADAGVPGFEIFVDRPRRDDFMSALRAAGAVELDEATAEAIRVESGVPRFGIDMDQDTIPLEAGIESRAISFTKGCYVGQEVIIRVLHRGHGRVARRLVGLTADGSVMIEPGTPVRSADRDIGRVTSAAWSPSLERPIALAYVQRDFMEPGTRVTAGDVPATVAALPFVQP
jgi:folate-binding protein YgfZ